MVLLHGDITASILWIGSLSPEVLHSYFTVGGWRGKGNFPVKILTL